MPTLSVALLYRSSRLHLRTRDRIKAAVDECNLNPKTLVRLGAYTGLGLRASTDTERVTGMGLLVNIDSLCLQAAEAGQVPEKNPGVLGGDGDGRYLPEGG